MNKKLYKSLVELSTDTGSRLEQIERSSMAMQESLKRDSQMKFAKMTAENTDRTQVLEKELNGNIVGLRRELNNKIDAIGVQMTTKFVQIDEKLDTMSKEIKT